MQLLRKWWFWTILALVIIGVIFLPYGKGKECEEICMRIGTKSEGIYNNCTMELVKYERCFCSNGIAYVHENKLNCVEDYVPGEIVVGFYDNVSLEQAKELINKMSLEYQEDHLELGELKSLVVNVPVGEEEYYIYRFQNEEIVEYAEPGFLTYVD